VPHGFSPNSNPQAISGYPRSTLTTVLQAVRDHFAAAVAIGYAAPKIYLGERYLRQEEAPRRLVLIPDGVPGGEWSLPSEMGAGLVADASRTCLVYVWGAENADDFMRYRDAEALAYDFLTVLRRRAPGCIKPLGFGREQLSNVVTFGEELVIGFAYEGGVERNGALWNVDIPARSDDTNAPTQQLSPPPFDAPPGVPVGTGLVITPIVTPILTGGT
jgi:hypothetical protein